MGNTLSSSLSTSTTQEHDWSKGYQPSGGDSSLAKHGFKRSRPTTSSGTLNGAGSSSNPNIKEASSSPSFILGGFSAMVARFGSAGSNNRLNGGEELGHRAKKRGDFRKMVESKKIVIGEPIKDTFQHLSHMGSEDVGTATYRSDFRKKVESKKIVIGSPINGTFQHVRHLGADDVTIH
ncbi:UNVERIFIED_CONTAM: hypothetical protein HDU68_009904 [Siphonaria sp. JEL0065]|nr:hypothetical protein HDU68_009904 [Siphonaria sp. JEL0065]